MNSHINSSKSDDIIQKLRKESKIKDIILKVSKELGNHNNLNSFLKKIHKELISLLSAHNFYVALYDSKTDLYSFPYFVDEEEQTINPDPHHLKKSLTDFVRKTGKSQIIDDNRHKELFEAGLVDYIGPYSHQWLGAPLRVNKKLIGVVAIQEYSEKTNYSEEDLKILSFIADNISVFIERIQNKEIQDKYTQNLERIVNDRTQELVEFNNKLAEDLYERERQNKIHKALFEISQTVSKSDNLDVLFAKIHIIINNLLPAKNFYFALLDDKNEYIHFPYYVDEYDKGEIPPMQYGEGLTSYLIKTGRNLVLNEISIKKLEDKLGISQVGAPTKTWIGVILKIRKKTIGAMVVQEYDSVPQIGEKDKQLLSFVSEQVALAIENKRSEIKINDYLNDLKDKQYELENSFHKINNLNRELLMSERKLKELVASKDKFFSIIAHDLKSPFQSLIGSSELLTNEYDELSDQERKYFMVNINKSVKSVYNLIENLLEWSRLIGGKIVLYPEILNLHERICNVIEILNEQARIKNIRLINNVKGKMFITADKYMIETVLRNLISNAIKFSHPGGEVTINAVKEKSLIVISVIDHGIGINPEAIYKMFKIDESFSNPGTNNEKGTGLGLILCNELIELSGGEINVISEEGKGSCFNISLPSN